MQQLGKDFGYAVSPQLGTTKAVFGGSHVLAMPKVMVEDPKVLQPATTFIKYLWDNAIDWYAAGQTPARISIAESQELKEKLPHIYVVSQESEYVKQFQMFPLISEIEAEIAVYLDEILVLHSISHEEGMKEAEFAVQEILDDYWSRVK
jgi:multiple sugar transport system substrate-binding protein